MLWLIVEPGHPLVASHSDGCVSDTEYADTRCIVQYNTVKSFVTCTWSAVGLKLIVCAVLSSQLSLGGWKATDLGRNSHLSVGRLIPVYNAGTREAGSAAEVTATRKTAKYSDIQAHHIFQPVAVESLSPINVLGHVFFS